MPNAFVVKAASHDVPTYSIPGVFESLVAGRARIGWSYSDDLDLRIIRDQVRAGAWENLTEDQKDAWRCSGFLERVNIDDYLVYPNQPTPGQFCIARVTGNYDYATDANSLDGDFRSFRPCELVTPTPLLREDRIVPPTIRRKMGLQGRFYQLCDADLFQDLLRELPHAGNIEGPGIAPRVGRIVRGISRDVARRLQEEFPAHDLSRRFCQELFTRMGYSFRVQEGPGERGSDLVVTVGSDLLPREFTVGVQVKSFQEDVSLNDLRETVTQLENGWDANALDYGVVLTTGICSVELFEFVAAHNRDKPTHHVLLIDGQKLAELFIQHFGAPDDEE
jgi:hypothetical protein